MSVGDAITSLMYFLGTWMVPKDTPGVWMAAGTIGTCSAQGFLLQMFTAYQFYNAYLAIYFVLTILYNYRDEKNKSNELLIRLEKGAHIFTFLFGLGTAVTILFLETFNSVLLWCWIESVPPGSTNPKRGLPSKWWQYGFWYIWMWSTFGIVVIGMLVLVWTTKKRLKASLSARVAKRALLYLSAYFLTNVGNIVNQTFTFSLGMPNSYPALLIITATLPLQGFWNCLIYFHPKFQMYRKDRVRQTNTPTQAIETV